MKSTRSKTTGRRHGPVGLVLALGLALLAAPVHAEDVKERARADLRKTIDEVLAVLGSETEDADVKLEQLLALAEKRFDLPRMTKLVLGRNRRQLSPEQQSEFQAQFTRHLTLTYGDAIDDFSDEKVEIGKARVERNKDVTIETHIVGGSADDTRIDYRMREKDGVFLVIDVIPEGISIIQNFRAQVNEIVNAKGADELIRTLQEKNDRDLASRVKAGA